jgi:DNA-3-methyladenine glycosylase II
MKTTFSLEPVPPFRLDLTVWVLRRRPDNSWDRWDGETYRRTLPTQNGPLDVAVRQAGPPEAAHLQVSATAAQMQPDAEAVITAALNRLLGLQKDMTAFYRLAAADPRLGPLAERFSGVKPPRFLTLFEALVNGIACQQITLTQGIRLEDRLAEKYGLASVESAESAHAFPRPEDLAAAEPAALSAMGFSRQKVLALLTLAGDITEGRLNLEALETMDDEAALAHLLALRGVGRWTAEYVQLRGLGRLHVFPGDDVGARKNLRGWLGQDEPSDYEGVRRLVAPWEPFAGLLYFHLLLDRIAKAGYLS